MFGFIISLTYNVTIMHVKWLWCG